MLFGGEDQKPHHTHTHKYSNNVEQNHGENEKDMKRRIKFLSSIKSRLLFNLNWIFGFNPSYTNRTTAEEIRREILVKMET